MKAFYTSGVLLKIKDRFDKFYNEYVCDGGNKADAAEIAEERLQPFKQKVFFENYRSLLKHWFPLMTNDLYHSIMQQINKLRQEGIRLTNTVKLVLKNSHQNFAERYESEELDDEYDEEIYESDNEDSGDELE